jgi:hypothetical protein
MKIDHSRLLFDICTAAEHALAVDRLRRARSLAF